MIFITGANGYVGAHLVARLRGEGRPVRALVRRGCAEQERSLIAASGAEVVEAHIDEAPLIRSALEGAGTVVHLLGSIERPPRGGYRGMHTLATRFLVDSFLAAGGGRGKIVYLSVLGAAPDAGNAYGRTKWEAEEEIRRSGIAHVILRSSLIFGRETGSRDSKLVRKLARLALARRAVPLVGGGRNRVQPIYIGDLVSCIVAAIGAPVARGGVWEVGGPRVMTLREVAISLSRALGCEREIARVPYGAAYLLALASRALGREGTLNLEQVRMSRRDAVCADNAAGKILGSGLVGFEEGMEKAVRRFGAAAIAGGAGS